MATTKRTTPTNMTMRFKVNYEQRNRHLCLRRHLLVVSICWFDAGEVGPAIGHQAHRGGGAPFHMKTEAFVVFHREAAAGARLWDTAYD